MSKDEGKDIKATLIKKEHINKMFMAMKGHQNIQSTNGQIDFFFLLTGSFINNINQSTFYALLTVHIVTLSNCTNKLKVYKNCVKISQTIKK